MGVETPQKEEKMTFRERISEINPEALLLPENYDNALMGYINQWNAPTVAAYSSEKIVRVLQQDGLSYEDAYEYYEFNIAGAYLGENTPLFLHMEET